MYQFYQCNTRIFNEIIIMITQMTIGNRNCRTGWTGTHLHTHTIQLFIPTDRIGSRVIWWWWCPTTITMIILFIIKLTPKQTHPHIITYIRPHRVHLHTSYCKRIGTSYKTIYKLCSASCLEGVRVSEWGDKKGRRRSGRINHKNPVYVGNSCSEL